MAAWQGLFFYRMAAFGPGSWFSVSGGSWHDSAMCLSFASKLSWPGSSSERGQTFEMSRRHNPSCKPFTASTEFATVNVPLTTPRGQGQVQRIDELSSWAVGKTSESCDKGRSSKPGKRS